MKDKKYILIGALGLIFMAKDFYLYKRQDKKLKKVQKELDSFENVYNGFVKFQEETYSRQKEINNEMLETLELLTDESVSNYEHTLALLDRLGE